MEAQYVTHEGTMHLSYDVMRSFCGAEFDTPVTIGLPTTSGLDATCSRCRRISELQPPRF